MADSGPLSTNTDGDASIARNLERMSVTREIQSDGVLTVLPSVFICQVLMAHCCGFSHLVNCESFQKQYKPEAAPDCLQKIHI